jgi:glyoxylase-like metal-dependent hydrolase (beta-lactamase superfamily II)
MKKQTKPILNESFLVTDLGNGIFNLTAPPLRFQQYLVLGKECALLIDTGFGLGSLKKETDALTQLPILLVNTHGHPDHSGGNAEYGRPYLDTEDNEVYAVKCSYEARAEEAQGWGISDAADRLQPTPPEPIPLPRNHVFDLGGRTLRVIHTPGHTHGSVCLLEEESGILFSGDTVQSTPTALLGTYATTVSQYAQTLEALRQYPIRAICPGHRDTMLSPELIEKKLQCARRILDGETTQTKYTREGLAYTLTVEGAAIEFSPGKLK